MSIIKNQILGLSTVLGVFQVGPMKPRWDGRGPERLSSESRLTELIAGVTPESWPHGPHCYLTPDPVASV